MPKFTVEVNVTDAQIQRAVDSAGKFDSWRIKSLATSVVDNKIKQKMRKAFGNIDEMIDDAIESIDWKEVVMNRIAERAQYDE